MSEIDWGKILDTIAPNESNEAVVSEKFARSLLKALGFSQENRVPQFSTGNGPVDFAAGRNNFSASQENPYLLLEVKARANGAGTPINLSEGTSQHAAIRNQIIKYLLAPKCQSAQWGLITNCDYIQLFRRHGKVVIPATASLLVKKDNLPTIIAHIQQLIDNPPKALTVCIYNNKGGAGKTTTGLNLAAILRKLNKKVLLVDFDSQRDLTKSLDLKVGSVSLFDCLTDTSLDIRKTVVPFRLNKNGKSIHAFDVIPSDPRMEEYTDSSQVARIQKGPARLRDLLKTFVNSYEYILIDCPTQWLFFSQSGVCASDVVLIPTKPNGFASLHNAARVIKDFIPEIKKVREDGGPIALPIFFNGEKITEPMLHLANFEIVKIIERSKKEFGFNLLSYYWPKATKGKVDKTIFSIPSYATVASAAFSYVPAVFVNKIVANYYEELVKEYFL